MRLAKSGSAAFVGVAVVAGLGTLVGVRPAGAVTLDLPLSANGQAESTDQTNFFINYPANPVYIDWTPDNSTIEERRGILEFNLSGLPAGALVRSADLLFNVATYESRSSGSTTLNPSLTFWSYAGNNAVDVSDAKQVSNALAILTVDGTGPFDAPLNLGRFTSLLAGHPAAVGINVYANSEDLTTGIWTAATPPTIAAPTIEVNYAPAGDANFDDKVNGDDYALIDRGYARHLTGWSNGDFNGDGTINSADYLILDTAYGQAHALSPELLESRASAFGEAYVSALVAAVPEPSLAFGLLGMAAAGRLGRRRIVSAPGGTAV